MGLEEELGQDSCIVGEMHYVLGEEPSGPFSATARIRYRHREVAVTAMPLAEGRLHVRFAHSQRDVTPGQYLVLYDGDVVVGGGAICAA